MSLIFLSTSRDVLGTTRRSAPAYKICTHQRQANGSRIPFEFKHLRPHGCVLCEEWAWPLRLVFNLPFSQSSLIYPDLENNFVSTWLFLTVDPCNWYKRLTRTLERDLCPTTQPRPLPAPKELLYLSVPEKCIPYPGCQRLFMRGFRVRSSFKKWPNTPVFGLRPNTYRPAADETKLPDAHEKNLWYPGYVYLKEFIHFQSSIIL